MVSSAAIVVTSSSATIKMKFRTMTVGIGESATINLSEDGGYNDFRWRHNYGDVIQMWNSKSSIAIKNTRATDDGVYECYGSDSRDDNRGIMRLIVRDCPLPKWNPPECEMDCPVCYNGGVCDDKTGQCICPAGFKGEYCQTSCGSNNFGRDCDLVCSAGNDEACKGKLFCPPDPFGCTCINGYRGDDCNTECDNNHYGADCRQVCHCDSGGCDRKTGNCSPGSSCSINYTGPACQELLPGLSCPPGFFGLLCNYPCHCKDSADCNRNGSCDNGCHKAWAGEDCSIGNIHVFKFTLNCVKLSLNLDFTCLLEVVPPRSVKRLECCFDTGASNSHAESVWLVESSSDTSGLEVIEGCVSGGSGLSLLVSNSADKELILQPNTRVAAAVELAQQAQVVTFQTDDVLQVEVKEVYIDESHILNTSSATIHSEARYPGKPTISTLTSTSSSITLELTLSDDNPCTILGYNVLVYSDLQDLEFNIDTTATSLTINENIMPNTNYIVQVAARTQKGFGNFSDVGYVSTNADNPVKGAVVAGGLVGGLSVILFVIVFTYYVKRYKKNKKTDHTITTVKKDTPIYYANENVVMSQADEVTYETPKKTEEESYEQLTYNQPDSDSSTEKALDGTYENLPPSSPEKVVENTHHVRPKHQVVTSLSKPKKSKHTITKLNTPITCVNLSNAVSKADESAYETPIPTVQTSYEQLTYKQPACETCTKNNSYSTMMDNPNLLSHIMLVLNLDEERLRQLKEKLFELGVENYEDLTFVEQEELVPPLKIVEARKFLSRVKGGSIPNAPDFGLDLDNLTLP
ncbi:uncharacterized protein LOC117119278 [Anneissia japonica]|uniref:uncharacterized protein LOC117119278 n=1 Tax=Anneissia japonica TaxID=1529436 RepID=UPI001425ABCD|nr:uncharacterized protein LOC117119278 [Anneissia japonica]